MKRQKKRTNDNPSLIRPRIYLGPELMVGPGKIALLKGVRETASISAAARQLGMNYKRAWYLLDTLNQGFHQPVVEAVHGGRGGGGARLTALGEALIAAYEAKQQLRKAYKVFLARPACALTSIQSKAAGLFVIRLSGSLLIEVACTTAAAPHVAALVALTTPSSPPSP